MRNPWTCLWLNHMSYSATNHKLNTFSICHTVHIRIQNFSDPLFIMTSVYQANTMTFMGVTNCKCHQWSQIKQDAVRPRCQTPEKATSLGPWRPQTMAMTVTRYTMTATATKTWKTNGAQKAWLFLGHVALHVYGKIKNVKMRWKVHSWSILSPTLCAGAQCKLAQLHNFPPNVQSLHYSYTHWTLLDKFPQVMALVVLVCGRHYCGHHSHSLRPSWLWPSWFVAIIVKPHLTVCAVVY